MLMSIKNVRKRFGDLEVLKNVHMDIDKGDVVVILGPSGSGKTTFLRCLNFLERADAGEMDFAGMEIDLSHPSKKGNCHSTAKDGLCLSGLQPLCQ